MPIDNALQQLLALPPEEQEIALLALEEKRKSQHAAKYWASDPDEKFARFYNQIEDDFKKFTDDTKIYALLGGNRSSKTERGAFLAVAFLLGKDYFIGEPSWRYVKDLPIPDAGVNVWCVGVDYNVIRDVLWGEKLTGGTRKHGLVPDEKTGLIERKSNTEFQLTVNVNGRRSTLTCKSADSGREKFQSASVDLLWIDEEIDAEVFDEAYMRTADCGGKIVLTLTPLTDVGSGSKKPWVFDLHKKWIQGQKDLVFIKLNTLENPYIPQIEKDRLLEKWQGHPQMGARLYGEFFKRAGLVYSNWDRKVHVVKPFRIEQDWKRVASIDPAPTGITAVVWAAVDPRGNIYLYRVYYEKGLTISDHCKDILVRNGHDPIDVWLLDPFAGIQRNAETHRTMQDLYKSGGIPCRLAPKAEDFGREIMREYLEASLNPTSRHPKLYVFDSCTPLIEEVEQYVWDSFARGPNKGMSKDKPVKRMDHAINATQYLLSLRPRGRRTNGSSDYNSNNSYS